MITENVVISEYISRKLSHCSAYNWITKEKNGRASPITSMVLRRKAKVRKRDGAKMQSPRLEAQTPFSSPERVLCTKRACGAGNPGGTLEHHLLGCTQHP